MTAPPPLAELLLGALHHDPSRLDVVRLAALDPEESRALVAYASEQRVASFLAYRLANREPPIEAPAELRAPLQEYRRACVARSLRLEAEFRTVARVLQGEGIPVLALKGVHLAHAVYPEPALREMNDLDVLVPRADLILAAAALGAAGRSALYEGDPDTYLPAKKDLARVALDPNYSTEVHWTLTDPGHPYSILPDELWERSGTAVIAGREIRVLSPEDLLLHLALHVSYQHQFAFGLRPACDLAAVAAHAKLDWDAVVRRAERWSWSRGVYLALRLAVDLVGASVPPEALRAMKPPAFDPAVLANARAETLADKAYSKTTSAALAQVWGGGDVRGRLVTLRASVFIAPERIRRQFQLPPDTSRLWPYYVLRVRHLVSRWRGVVWRLVRGDRALKALVGRKSRIADYLTAPPE